MMVLVAERDISASPQAFSVRTFPHVHFETKAENTIQEAYDHTTAGPKIKGWPNQTTHGGYMTHISNGLKNIYKILIKKNLELKH